MHRLRLVLPELGTALDIGEKKTRHALGQMCWMARPYRPIRIEGFSARCFDEQPTLLGRDRKLDSQIRS
jgi:hypothetical protein